MVSRPRRATSWYSLGFLTREIFNPDVGLGKSSTELGSFLLSQHDILLEFDGVSTHLVLVQDSQYGENTHEQSECPDNILALSVDSICVPMNMEVATSHSFPNSWRRSELYRKVRLVKINSPTGCHGPW